MEASPIVEPVPGLELWNPNSGVWTRSAFNADEGLFASSFYEIHARIIREPGTPLYPSPTWDIQVTFPDDDVFSNSGLGVTNFPMSPSGFSRGHVWITERALIVLAEKGEAIGETVIDVSVTDGALEYGPITVTGFRD